MPQILLSIDVGLSHKFSYQVSKLLDENREFHIKIPCGIPTPLQHSNSRRFKEKIPVFQGHFECLKSPILQISPITPILTRSELLVVRIAQIANS